jgi:hypothetical protein
MFQRFNSCLPADRCSKGFLKQKGPPEIGRLFGKFDD